MPNGPVHHPRGKVIEDPQVVHNGLLINYEHESAPLPLRQPRPAAKFPETTDGGWLRYKAPLLGEHSTELLLEAGMSEEEVAALIDSGVVMQGQAKKLDPSKARDAKSRDVASG